MLQIFIHLFLRALLITMFVNDIRTTKKVLSKDTSLHREFTKQQKNQRILYYIVLVAGILVPFEWIYLIVTLIAYVVFFVFTDREIYIGNQAIYFRANFFEYKRIENIRYENKTLQFDYKKEHVKLSHPFLSDEVIEKEIVGKVNKLLANQEKRKHKKNN